MTKYSGELLLTASLGMLLCVWLNWWVIFPLFMIFFFVVYVAIGVERKGKLGPAATILGVMGAGYLVLFYLLIFLYKANPTGMPKTYFLGFPPATAVLVYGIWLLPLLLGVAYALIFDNWIIKKEDLERIQVHSWKKKENESISIKM